VQLICPWPWVTKLVLIYDVIVPVHVGFVVDKVAMGQVFPRALRFSPVNFIPPVFHYTEKRKND
jgi:hypothetical protein